MAESQYHLAIKRRCRVGSTTSQRATGCPDTTATLAAWRSRNQFDPGKLLAIDARKERRLHAIKVLVVEDDALLHDLLQDVLESSGFTATMTLKGDHAIAALEAPEAEWCALITDIRLGRDQPTGWDVARRAREIDPDVPVIYMTGDSAVDWSRNGVPNSTILTKPFAPAQIVTAVTQLLNRSRL